MFASVLKIQHGEEDKPKVVCEYAGVVFMAFTVRGMAITAGETTPVQWLSIFVVCQWGPFELGFLGFYSSLHRTGASGCQT